MPPRGRTLKELTSPQRAALAAIIDHIRSEGFPPSIRDIMQRTGAGSTGSVHRQLQGLVKKGYIERKPGICRAMRVLRMP